MWKVKPNPAEAPNISLLEALVRIDNASAKITTKISRIPIFNHPDASCVLRAYRMMIGRTSKIVLATETIAFTKPLTRSFERYSVLEALLRARSSRFMRRYCNESKCLDPEIDGTAYPSQQCRH